MQSRTIGIFGPGRRQIRRRDAIKAASLGAGGMAAAIACGRPGAGKQTAQSGPGSAAAQPKTGGTFTARIFTDFFDYDMSYAGKSQPNPDAGSLIYEPLLGIQQGPNVPYDHVTITPRLAAKWEISPDASTYTFHLQPGVRFANLPPVNGRELTSADVKWSFEYYSRTGDFKTKKLPAANFAWMLQGLQGVETPDPNTAVLRFSQPFAPFLNYNYTYALNIVPHEIYDADGNLSKRTAGTGPFLLDETSSQRGTHWVLKKNPDYWQQGKPYVDQIQYLVLPDDSTAYAAFKTRQIDAIKVNSTINMDTVANSNPGATRQAANDPTPQNLYMSVRRPPFNDLRLRQAVSYAIDRDEWDRTFSGGKGGWGMSGAFPDSWTQEEIKQIVRFDPARAKSLLTEAGYGSGLNVALEEREGADQKASQLLQAQLKKVGINVDIQHIDKATGSKRLYSGDFTMIILYENTYADPDSWLYGQNFSSSSANWIGVNDPKLDQLILTQRREPDPAKRRQAVRDASKYIAENALSLALYRRVGSTFWWPYVKNYADHWLQYGWNGGNIWLDK